jgi:hypothetical protein
MSLNAKFFFNMELDSFHSCKILKETDDQYLVKSINEQQKFWIEKTGNQHWKVTV